MHRQRMPLCNGIGRDLEQVVKLGRGAFFSKDCEDMEQTMLLVKQGELGWSVSFKGWTLLSKASKVEAIDAANAHAHDRYAVTGQPIGVFLRMACGDEILVGQHG